MNNNPSKLQRKIRILSWKSIFKLLIFLPSLITSYVHRSFRGRDLQNENWNKVNITQKIYF